MNDAGRLACAAAASICLLCASLVAGRTLLEGLPFDMPSECAGIASVNVLRLLQQIQRDCPRPPPEGYNCPGSCGDALASVSKGRWQLHLRLVNQLYVQVFAAGST